MGSMILERMAETWSGRGFFRPDVVDPDRVDGLVVDVDDPALLADFELKSASAARRRSEQFALVEEAAVGPGLGGHLVVADAPHADLERQRLAFSPGVDLRDRDQRSLRVWRVVLGARAGRVRAGRSSGRRGLHVGRSARVAVPGFSSGES